MQKKFFSQILVITLLAALSGGNALQGRTHHIDRNRLVGARQHLPLLIEANVENSTEKLSEIQKLVETLLEGWRGAVSEYQKGSETNKPSHDIKG